MREDCGIAGIVGLHGVSLRPSVRPSLASGHPSRVPAIHTPINVCVSTTEHVPTSTHWDELLHACMIHT
jgi:hypothetical protein